MNNDNFLTRYKMLTEEDKSNLDDCLEQIKSYEEKHENLSKKLKARSPEEVEYDNKVQDEFLADIQKEKKGIIKSGNDEDLPELEAHKFACLTESHEMGLGLLEDEIEKLEQEALQIIPKLKN